MCHIVHFSTDCPRDLAGRIPDAAVIEPADKQEVVEKEIPLRYPHQWFLLCRYGGCSCHFRNLLRESAELDLAPPVDWFEEDEDDIVAT